MGLFDGKRQQAARALMELYRRRDMRRDMPIPESHREWQEAYGMLLDHYTREAAETDSVTASLRIK